MRTFAIGTIAMVLLAASCASPTSVDVDSAQEVESPVSVSPVTTSPVSASPATTSPVTTSPVAISGGAPSDEPIAPSGDQDGDSDSEEQEPTVTTQPPKWTPTSPIQPVEPLPLGPVAAAIADLALRLGVDESHVTLVSQEEVTWPDGSLGCPQPGMGYAQVLVSGSLVVLQVNGVSYEYHSGGGNDLFYCATPTPPTAGGYGDA